MPVSKKRKKKGTVAKFKQDRREERRKKIEADIDAVNAGVSLQDLINVVAAQEAVSSKAKIDMPDSVPVFVGEGEDKHQVGEASPIPGDEEHISIHITDSKVIRQIHESKDNYSIEEQEDGR